MGRASRSARPAKPCSQPGRAANQPGRARSVSQPAGQPAGSAGPGQARPVSQPGQAGQPGQARPVSHSQVPPPPQPTDQQRVSRMVSCV